MRTLTQQERDLFAALFDAVEREDDGNLDVLPLRQWMTQGNNEITLRGADIDILNQLGESLAGSTQLGGLSEAAADELVTAGCSRLVDGLDRAGVLEWVEEQLNATPTTRTLFSAIEARLADAILELGCATLHRNVDSAFEPHELIEFNGRLRSVFPDQLLSTTVTAADKSAAALIADSRFELARAILIFADSSAPLRGVSAFRSPEGALGYGLAATDFQTARMFDDSGAMQSFYETVIGVAAKEESTLNDWEKRCIAALRWFATGASTSWPAKRLVGFVTALEELLVANKFGNKKQPLSERATESPRVP